jgi:hypothetical protein
MLVIFKSAPILKKILRIKHSMLQLYTLKLLKMQTRQLGRQWRKISMSVISLIYQKVRHRLNDDWAFGNESDAQNGWDFQSDEYALRTKIDRFNQNRYKSNDESLSNNLDDLTIDTALYSNLNKNVELPQEFLDNYEQWLEREVYNNNIDWDAIINNTSNQKQIEAIYDSTILF